MRHWMVVQVSESNKNPIQPFSAYYIPGPVTSSYYSTHCLLVTPNLRKTHFKTFFPSTASFFLGDPVRTQPATLLVGPSDRRLVASSSLAGPSPRVPGGLRAAPRPHLSESKPVARGRRTRWRFLMRRSWMPTVAVPEAESGFVRPAN